MVCWLWQCKYILLHSVMVIRFPVFDALFKDFCSSWSVRGKILVEYGRKFCPTQIASCWKSGVQKFGHPWTFFHKHPCEPTSLFSLEKKTFFPITRPTLYSSADPEVGLSWSQWSQTPRTSKKAIGLLCLPANFNCHLQEFKPSERGELTIAISMPKNDCNWGFRAYSIGREALWGTFGWQKISK